MRKNRVLITQSNYIPWKGFFDAIRFVDSVILYDDMQYTKRDWRNRNKIKTPNGAKWLTIPVEVKGKYYQAIKDTKIENPKWTKSHWESIRQNYSKTRYFKEYKLFFEELLLSRNEEYLSSVNFELISGICNFLGLNKKIVCSMDFNLVDGKTERLVDLCKKVGANEYCTGPRAKSYINESLFLNENISLHYFDYSDYPEYTQLYGDFVHEVSIIDLIFNEGGAWQNFMKETI